MKTIDLHATRVHLRPDGLLHIHIKAGAALGIADALDVLDAMKALGNGKKFPVFIDAGEFASVDRDVRIFSASEEGNIYTLADAIAYHSLAQKLVADFYVNQNKPIVPTRTFSDDGEAIEWLKTFLKTPA
jgi:hypothetical protein